MTPGGEFRDRLRRVEGLVAALEAYPDPAARGPARALVRALLDLHAAGLAKVLELVAGHDLTDRLAGDELVSGLLLLHGLHPHPAEVRVRRSLGRAGPRFRSLGGGVELVAATDEVVRLRLRGDSAAGPALRAAAGDVVLEAVPDVATVEFEEAWDPAPSGRVPLPLAATGGDR